MVSYADVAKQNVSPHDHGADPSADHLERGAGGTSTIGHVDPTDPYQPSSSSNQSSDTSNQPSMGSYQSRSSDANRAQDKAQSAAKDAKSSAEKKANEFNRDPDVRKAKQTMKRPEVWGSALGFLNLAILGAVGYQAYQYKDQTWDRRNVTLVSVGLFAWFGGQSILGAEAYNQNKK